MRAYLLGVARERSGRSADPLPPIDPLHPILSRDREGASSTSAPQVLRKEAKRSLRAIGAWAALALTLAAAQRPTDPYTAARERMVREHIEARGIADRGVLDALRAIPRHLFVPGELAARAYDDRPLPIGYKATISQPYIVALMTELLAPRRGHTVLEIGTGSGYQAAVLARLAAHVYTIELIPDLAASAAERLRAMGYRNVTVRQGDGYLGWPDAAPFDRIIVTAAPPEVPRALTDQLRRGGRLVAPVGEGLSQELFVVDKAADGSLRRRKEGAVLFVPMVPGRK